MTNSGYKSREYEVVPYDPKWKERFKKEIKPLRKIFKNKATLFEHIGSTSVPGMVSKPTIDILITVKNIEDSDELSSKIETLGYKSMGEYIKKNSRFFFKEKDNRRVTNLHIFEDNHPHAEEMLSFRDYLRSHPETVKEYGQLKLNLYKKYPNSYKFYRKYKGEYLDDLNKDILL